MATSLPPNVTPLVSESVPGAAPNAIPIGVFGAKGDPWKYDVRPDGSIAVTGPDGRTRNVPPASQTADAILEQIRSGQLQKDVAPTPAAPPGIAAEPAPAAAPRAPTMEFPEATITGSPSPEVSVDERMALGAHTNGSFDDRIDAAVAKHTPDLRGKPHADGGDVYDPYDKPGTTQDAVTHLAGLAGKNAVALSGLGRGATMVKKLRELYNAADAKLGQYNDAISKGKAGEL